MKIKKDINIQVGERIKAMRERSGFTQEHFSEMIDVSAQYISDVERGNVGISITTLKKMCNVLCVSSDTILFGQQHATNIDHITEKLRNIDPEYLPILQIVINKYLEAIAISKR
ncbi:MAG: helix-turn-helix transcriptional regulator [Clostridia bacterium]